MAAPTAKPHMLLLVVEDHHDDDIGDEYDVLGEPWISKLT